MAEYPTTGVAEFIRDLAGRNGVVYVKTYADVWAETVTKLCDDDVVTDEIDGLLIALKRAGVISGKEMVGLLAGYLREQDENLLGLIPVQSGIGKL